MVSSLVETGIPELEVMDHLVELIKEQAKDLLMEKKYLLEVRVTLEEDFLMRD